MSERIGRYHLINRIATGGMAEIWLARQEGPAGFEKDLVIKRILPHLAQDERFVEMFLDEARLAARLNHPNIGQIFDLGEVDGQYFIAMEYIDGWDLSAIVDRSTALDETVSPLLAARLVADAATALGFAHRFRNREGEHQGLVHRDVSPQNILVSRDGVVKLVDFGIAKAATQSHKTQTGAVKGKLSYMAPEQIEGQTLDGRTDLFALGIVFYELLTGQRPFGHESELAAVTAILTQEPPQPTDLQAALPTELEYIVLKALAKRPDDRFQDATEMQRELDHFLMRQGTVLAQRDIADYLHVLFDPARDPATTSRSPEQTSLTLHDGKSKITALPRTPLPTAPQQSSSKGTSALPHARPTRAAASASSAPQAPADSKRPPLVIGAVVAILIALIGVTAALLLRGEDSAEPEPATALAEATDEAAAEAPIAELPADPADETAAAASSANEEEANEEPTLPAAQAGAPDEAKPPASDDEAPDASEEMAETAAADDESAAPETDEESPAEPAEVAAADEDPATDDDAVEEDEEADTDASAAPAPAPAPTPAPAARPEPVRPATVQIRTQPPGRYRVFVNNEQRTNFMNDFTLRLTPGTYQIGVEPFDGGRRQTRTVRLGSGQTVNETFRF